MENPGFTELNKIYSDYQNCIERKFTKKRIFHADVISLSENLVKSGNFSLKPLGQSVEGREINLISFGSGKNSILCWSQMHGNESTATMALFDLFNFFKLKSKFRRKLIKIIKFKLKFYKN